MEMGTLKNVSQNGEREWGLVLLPDEPDQSKIAIIRRRWSRQF